MVNLNYCIKFCFLFNSLNGAYAFGKSYVCEVGALLFLRVSGCIVSNQRQGCTLTLIGTWCVEFEKLYVWK
jgi:hypothetical protein